MRNSKLSKKIVAIVAAGAMVISVAGSVYANSPPKCSTHSNMTLNTTYLHEHGIWIDLISCNCCGSTGCRIQRQVDRCTAYCNYCSYSKTETVSTGKTRHSSCNH